mmetsp:Transcript_48045/g.96257  ORF Transcript_48045/g.96257 Transcript_48045/m.96257 type:complete len:201 (+) Transcript_48045:749-1351(+)
MDGARRRFRAQPPALAGMGSRHQASCAQDRRDQLAAERGGSAVACRHQRLHLCRHGRQRQDRGGGGPAAAVDAGARVRPEQGRRQAPQASPQEPPLRRALTAAEAGSRRVARVRALLLPVRERAPQEACGDAGSAAGGHEPRLSAAAARGRLISPGGCSFPGKGERFRRRGVRVILGRGVSQLLRVVPLFLQVGSSVRWE